MYRFIAFDVDGVLTTYKSSWEMVHKAFGSKGSLEDMKRYFKGEISYEDWCERDKERWRISLGREPTPEDIDEIFRDIERFLSPHAREAVDLSKRRGLGVGLVSAGIEPSARRVAEALKVSLWMANPIYGSCEAKVEPRNKLRALSEMLSKLDVTLDETIYVGDSVIDLPALLGAGCGVGLGDAELKKYVDYWIPDLGGLAEALIYCFNNPRPSESYPHYEEYKYGYREGDDFPWVRFLNLD